MQPLEKTNRFLFPTQTTSNPIISLHGFMKPDKNYFPATLSHQILRIHRFKAGFHLVFVGNEQYSFPGIQPARVFFALLLLPENLCRYQQYHDHKCALISAVTTIQKTYHIGIYLCEFCILYTINLSKMMILVHKNMQNKYFILS